MKNDVEANSRYVMVRTELAGFVMKGYLGGWTLVIKSLGLAMTVAANLSVGKEGPSIHIACCAGHVVSRLFPKYQRSRAKSREIISASAAAGVAVAFGAPIGGVLFSFEVNVKDLIGIGAQTTIIGLWTYTLFKFKFHVGNEQSLSGQDHVA